MSVERPSVAFLPVFANPYQHLLARSLESAGVSIDLLEKLPSTSWLRNHRHEIDILHLHWLTGLYMGRYSTPLRSVQFGRWLKVARDYGYRLVWTAHNIMPHRDQPRPFHRAMRRLTIRNVDAVIAHCESGLIALQNQYPGIDNVHVIPIGNYVNTYPVDQSRSRARQRLKIDEQTFVYLSLGNIAPYKGIEAFLKAFRTAVAPDALALVAGRNRDARLVTKLEEIAVLDDRIQIHAKTIPDNRMQDYLLSADVMVIPFRKIWTSSSIMTALSYGLPVITPAMGCLPEMVGPNAGVVYHPQNPQALERALMDIRQRDLQHMGLAARQQAESYDWKSIGQQTADLYRECLRE